jgi:hypothetical protein
MRDGYLLDSERSNAETLDNKNMAFCRVFFVVDAQTVIAVHHRGLIYHAYHANASSSRSAEVDQFTI